MTSYSPSPSAAETVSRLLGCAGELALRERAGDYEIISNGVFLMDTRDGRSERLLVRWALDAAGSPRTGSILLAGLGVGFSLAEALSSPEVRGVLVVEREQPVVDWNRTMTGPLTGGNIDDPLVRCEIADIVAWLQRPATETFDVLCLDVDNGPNWTVDPGNAWLYADEGLAAAGERLVDGGVLTVWSADHVVSFERRLARHFREVRHREIPVAHGRPDVVYLARR